MILINIYPSLDPDPGSQKVPDPTEQYKLLTLFFTLYMYIRVRRFFFSLYFEDISSIKIFLILLDWQVKNRPFLFIHSELQSFITPSSVNFQDLKKVIRYLSSVFRYASFDMSHGYI